MYRHSIWNVQLPEHGSEKLSGHKSLDNLHFKSEVSYTQIALSEINNYWGENVGILVLFWRLTWTVAVAHWHSENWEFIFSKT